MDEPKLEFAQQILPSPDDKVCLIVYISPTVDIRTAVCISGVCSDLGCFVGALL